jgi:serine/threonine-protein kinase
VALLIGGVGYRYTADESPATAVGQAGPATAAPASTGPGGAILPPASASATTSASPAADSSVTPGATTTPGLPVAPGATPTQSPSAAPTGVPAPSVGSTPTPATTSPSTRPDSTAPTIGTVSASPSSLEPERCPYGARTSTVGVSVTDDRSTAAALKVSFRYTLGGTTSTVTMKSAGRGVFQGTLGPLPMPRSATRIPVSVVAVDAAGNAAESASPRYVSLTNTCTPG